MEKPKRKRPDRAVKLKQRTTHSETVVKSCLLKLLHDGEQKTKIVEAINKRVFNL